MSYLNNGFTEFVKQDMPILCTNIPLLHKLYYLYHDKANKI